MFILIHGNELESTRAKLLELKHENRAKEIRELNGKKLDPTTLTQALASLSLFGSHVLVVIEGFLGSAKKREKAFGTVLVQLQEAAVSQDIILVEDKEIDKATVAKLGSQAKVWLFKTPVVLFQFLDTLASGNAAHSLDLFHKVIQDEPAEIIFALLVRRVRQLIQLKDGVSPKTLQSWQVGRLTSQARHFTMEQLVDMHSNLLHMDIAIKTGNSPFTLTHQLEEFIIRV